MVFLSVLTPSPTFGPTILAGFGGTVRDVAEQSSTHSTFAPVYKGTKIEQHSDRSGCVQRELIECVP
jgi:hypothetical protein